MDSYPHLGGGIIIEILSMTMILRLGGTSFVCNQMEEYYLREI
jgi:hypothetical protein